ncbi:hypothetical protein [Paenibacillus pabuli]|uniref:hypothetical protein n=1 Tax=Paenibacillus pabuli TaxID=1472 RepID=UPI001FFF1587|nr:hypothetical protein [Paenibacillus pabuli]UPK45877.1 hypothetical protein KET34_10670 [Paenibacillus pabuli]
MFGLIELRKRLQAKKTAHEIAGPPYGSSSIKNGVYEPKIHIDGDITAESAERIAEALREKFGDKKPSAASIITAAGTIDYAPEEYAFVDIGLFERRLEFLDRLIDIQNTDSGRNYNPEINDIVQALMKDCKVERVCDNDEPKTK